MSTEYETNPVKIERESFRQIRELVDLAAFDHQQQQVAMRVVHSLGRPEIATSLRFSKGACASGIRALTGGGAILCDVEMVRAGITKRFIESDPYCFLNDPRIIEMAKTSGETRSMAAVSLWQPYLGGSVVLIGNAPTTLFRLLENFKSNPTRPALVIAMPVGFVGAVESKKLMWDCHRELGFECMTLLGREGGSAVTSASCNALLRIINGEEY